MEQMQEQMNAILGNPEMMQKIMAMAQSLGQSQPKETASPPPENPLPSLPDFDPALLKKLSGLAGGSNIDKDQRTLLSALRPYLSRERIAKLEKAMRAAKLATVASGIFGNFSGR